MNNEIKFLTPFKRMCMTIGTLPSSFYASMSYYESMVWLYEYLKNEVIPAVNNNGEAVEELQQKYLEFTSDINQEVGDFKDYINEKVEELETYMNNYFDNLDVQEEINTKLDEMALDGTLTNLIKDYVDPIYQAYENEINEEFTNYKTSVNSQISQIDAKVNNAISGTPKGVYATLSDLTTADPDHDYIYLVLADGNWYYYSSGSWTAGGVYQSSGVGENEIEAKNLSIALQENLYIKSPIYTITEGEYFFNIGTYQNAGFCHTSPIQLLKGEKIQFYGQGYNQNVNMISIVNNQCVPQGFRILCSDSTAKYYEFTAFQDCLVALCSTTGTKFNDVIIIKNTEQIMKSITQTSLTGTLYSGYRNINTGNIVAHNQYVYTENIKVADSTKYIIKNIKWNSSDNIGPACYDKYGNYIYTGIKYQNGDDFTFTTPAGCDYVIFSLNKDNIEKVYLEIADNFNDLAISLNNNINNKIDRVNGMSYNVAMYGDSLTLGLCATSQGNYYTNYYRYPYYLKKLIGYETDHILAFGGAKTDTFFNQYGGYILDQNSLCIIWFGTNDEFTDTVATDCAGNDWTQFAETETGYLGKIVGKCKAYGNNQILMINQFADNARKETNNKVIKDIADKFGCMLLDINNTDIRNLKYHTSYNGFIDNTHLNNLGNNYVANLIVNFLNNELGIKQHELYRQWSNNS